MLIVLHYLLSLILVVFTFTSDPSINQNNKQNRAVMWAHLGLKLTVLSPAQVFVRLFSHEPRSMTSVYNRRWRGQMGKTTGN